MLSELEGQLEHITYNNPDSGFTVARVRVVGHREPVTVVGRLVAVQPGETLALKGEWQKHPRFGDQFRVSDYRIRMPVTVHGIRKYLGSGLIDGLGPKMADRIVARFGTDTLEVIAKDIDRLSEVEGIGPKRIAGIARAWREQEQIRDLMLFLQDHDVGTGLAVRIFRQYGTEAIALLRENPFRLATEVAGIGFVIADGIAAKLGMPADAPQRIHAGVMHVLEQMAGEGHVYAPYSRLVEAATALLKVDREAVLSAVATALREKNVVIEDLNADPADFQPNHKAVYLARFHRCETGIAQGFERLLADGRRVVIREPRRALSWVADRLRFDLAASQREAVLAAVTRKCLVVTGGPGTGKTTIIRAVLDIHRQAGARTLCAAPTGRAAKRMREATDHPARTIHRLLEFSPTAGGFQRNRERPLDCDLLVVDEASMIDTVLMHHLIKAVPDGATVMLVGDVHQLPSVGPGNVLGDIIASGRLPVIRLTEIFRQARASRIVTSAHAINAGRMPPVTPPGTDTDFYFIAQDDPDAVRDIIVRLVTERIPERFQVDPVDDIQVLSPMHKGPTGTDRLNTVLQQALNPGADGLVRGDRHLHIGDKVMQTRNNYDKQVYNGDIGRITAIDAANRTVTVQIDDQAVIYDPADLDDIVPAYAVSVHKAQGSEFPVVILPVLTQHYVLLQRNLIYTAVTRGKRLVVLVGSVKALAMAVKNDRPLLRFTRLKERLAEFSQAF